MTRTDRGGNPILDGVEPAVPAARVAVSSRDPVGDRGRLGKPGGSTYQVDGRPW